MAVAAAASPTPYAVLLNIFLPAPNIFLPTLLA
jgi:hypothetical protein